MLKKTRVFGVVCILLAATPLAAQTKASCSAFTGTWYGSFRVLTPDGGSTRDNAVIDVQPAPGLLPPAAAFAPSLEVLLGRSLGLRSMTFPIYSDESECLTAPAGRIVQPDM